MPLRGDPRVAGRPRNRPQDAAERAHFELCTAGAYLTGKDDWPSKIEEEKSGDNLAADLRELVGRGGAYSDVSGHSSRIPRRHQEKYRLTEGLGCHSL